MQEIDHHKYIEILLRTLNAETMELTAREGSSTEFKENFNWSSKDKYAKPMAAFANNKGGYLVFGVTNAPRRVTGLTGHNLENIDEATIASYLNSTFAPELHFEKFFQTIHGAPRTHPSRPIHRL